MQYSRRTFLLTAAGACAAVVGGDAFAIEPAKVLVSRHDGTRSRARRAFDGMRLAQVTDVHFPGNIAAASATLAHLQREKPRDRGDHRGHHRARPGPHLGGGVRSRGPRQSCDRRYLGQLGVPVPRLVAGGGGLPECRSRAARERASGDPCRRLCSGARGPRRPCAGPSGPPRRAGRPALGPLGDLAGPRPRVRVASTRGVQRPPAFILSGHTHGGQIRLPFVPAYTPEGSGRFVAGWYTDTFAPLYVSRGIGTTTIPARFGCPPELPIFTLRRA